jgi:hypothetical protein
VSSDDAGEAFDLVEGRMHLTIAPSRLPRQKAAAMKDVALLVSAARQAAGVDAEWTAAGAIRDECRDLGVLDGNNFAAEVAQLDAYLSFRGTGRSRLLKVNRRGYEEAGRRLRDLLSS